MYLQLGSLAHRFSRAASSQRQPTQGDFAICLSRWIRQLRVGGHTLWYSLPVSFVLCILTSDVTVVVSPLFTISDTLQLLLQFEQEKGDKERLDWLVSEGKKQVWRRK